MRDLIALVIDNDKSLVQEFAVVLQHCGFIVQHISNATQALYAIETIRPDVITLDLHMPQVSGIDILRTVRQSPELASLKIIVTTASLNMSHDPTVIELADAILIKPVNLAQFTSFVRRFAEQRHSEEMINGSSEV
jgi:two-component system, cell cycle response regulator DivK